MLTTIESQNNVPTAVHKLEKIIKTKGLTHFSTINHQDNATKIGLQLNPDTVVVLEILKLVHYSCNVIHL